MTFENFLNLDPRIWPLAVMAFLRVLSVFVWLPVFGDAVVPGRLRIALALMFTFFLWPSIEGNIRSTNHFMQWSPVTLAIATLRETLFGFATGFTARLLVNGASIATNLIGINMGFQAASIFSPSLGSQESALSSFKGWIVLVLLLNFNAHHLFLEGIARSFETVPIAPQTNIVAMVRMALKCVESTFALGIRLAAPVLVVQILVTVALGLLNRAIPQLNALALSFPLGFIVSMVVLFFSTAAYVRTIGFNGLKLQDDGMKSMQKSFAPPKFGGNQ